MQSSRAEIEVLPLLLICTLTACWYISSSKNAVASQRLVEKLDGGSPPFSEILVLTALQLLTGLCMARPLYQYLLSCGGSSPGPWKTQNKMILGVLHFLGCLCTNMGFALGSASVVQVIKLMEPIETLILTALANVMILKVSHGLTFMRTMSVIIIIAGTSMLLAQKRGSELGHQVNFGSVVFALCSGFAMASRNVFMKTSSLAAKPSRLRTKKPTSEGWKQIAVNGLFNYITITSAAAVPGTLCLVLAEKQNSFQISHSPITAWMFQLQDGKEAIVFHGLYNIASISILCLISTQCHSLLNVGKRIVNVLYSGIVFRESIGYNGIRGLHIAAVGGFLYTCESNISKTLTTRINLAMIVMTMVMTFTTKPEGYDFENLFFVSYDRQQLGSSPSSISKYAVWMFPQPPPAKNMHAVLSRDETLICAYSHACEALKDHVSTSVNLRDLTHGTYYHNYVRDHAYHKVRHLNDFPYHIQAITLLGLLKSSHVNGNVCVRTLGGNQEFCNDTEFDSYDPYDGIELNSTKYPYALLSDGKSKDQEQLALAPREIMLAEKFAMWGVGDIDNIRKYNSGEDVQSYAGAGWLPFVSEIRKKEQAIRNYNGHYIGNALMSSIPFNYTEEDFENMHKIHLTSIYSTEPGINGMENYLRSYTENIHPFGCRSLLTERILKQKKIKSYFSACLTLTTNMQGAILDNQHRKRYIMNEILKPNARELSTPKERNKIIFVDVQDPEVVPKSAWKSEHAIHMTADVPTWYPNCKKKLGRYSYSYKLLSSYANQAKVLVTSRIHAGLPAAALGIPVIFVEGAPGRSDWLPGGAQRVGRVEGLLDIFHRVQRGIEGKNWTFGNLADDVPHSDGVHLADRYRASFWNRLKKTHYYQDTGRLFGMIPMQRLGRKNVDKGVQELFHFVLESRSDLSWRTKRAIEHVLYFHPNSRVIVHSNQITAIDLEIFVETGYNLVVQPYGLDSLLKEEDLPYNVRNDDLIKVSLPLLLLRKYGGVYVSKNTFLLKTIPADFEEGLVLQENGNPSIAFFDRDSKDVVGSLKSIRSAGLKASYRLGWSVPALSDVETMKCVEDTEWSLPDDWRETIAVSLHPSSFASNKTIKVDTECYRFVEKLCIFCDEIHWDFN